MVFERKYDNARYFEINLTINNLKLLIYLHLANDIEFRRKIILKIGSYIPKNVLISKSNSLHLFFVLYNQHPGTSSQCYRSSRYSKFKQSHLAKLNSISYNSNLYGYKMYQICSAKFQISRICVRTQINCVTHLALIQFIWINGMQSTTVKYITNFKYAWVWSCFLT